MAARRAFSSLAHKIHPQLPLTPRESQQLLNLLTSSFRSHLDRDFPVGPSEAPLPSTTTQLATVEHGRRAPSSYDSTSEHIDSILSNPLFARRPLRRGSDSGASSVLKDPVAWFLDQIATGTASVEKASLCLYLLQKTRQQTTTRSGPLSNCYQRPASMIAEWLRTSGEETSKDFLILPAAEGDARQFFLKRLVPMLLVEDNPAPLWRWYTYDARQDGILTNDQIVPFKRRLLQNMVSVAHARDDAFRTFLRACRMFDGDKLQLSCLQVAGGLLVDRIVADPSVSSTPALYDEFALTTQKWLFTWKPVVQAMLCLHHPTGPDPQPGLKLMRDPDNVLELARLKKSRQKFLVRLCLGVAQRSIQEGKIADAQIAMDFTKKHFADLVLVKCYTSKRRASLPGNIKEEKRNIALLDSLVLT